MFCYNSAMKLVSFILSITVLAWILPLGYFIKPSQEKIACDGQRAFHMCTMNLVKPASEAADSRVKFTNPGTTTEKAKDSGMGAQTLLQNPVNFYPPFGFQFLKFRSTLSLSSISNPIDHPPQDPLFI